MQKDKQSPRFSLKLIAGIGLVVLALGGGVAWWARYSLNQTEQVETPPSLPETLEIPTPPEPLTQERTVKIGWLNPTKDQIQLVTQTLTVEESTQPNQLLVEAMENLLAGPPDSQTYTTTIPEGTKLLGLKVDKEGVHINLSQEFTSGGGSAAMSGRLAQVIYTATSLDEQSKVWIEVEGEPLVNLGGEGLILDQPMTREDFEANFTL